MNTSDLTGSALDWAVAKIIDGEAPVWDESTQNFLVGEESEHDFLNEFMPSTNWAQGGPIIDLERISIRTYAKPGHNWVAFIDCGGSSISGAKARQVGPTALTAAMRCFVASKLGDTVELPKELT